MNADILAIEEGPSTIDKMELFVKVYLRSKYVHAAG